MKLHKCKAKTKRQRYKRAEGAAQEYWEARLKKAGLTMDTGWNPDWLTYGHRIADLDFDGITTYAVKQIGEGLDNGDWPISLM